MDDAFEQRRAQANRRVQQDKEVGKLKQSTSHERSSLSNTTEPSKQSTETVFRKATVTHTVQSERRRCSREPTKKRPDMKQKHIQQNLRSSQ